MSEKVRVLRIIEYVGERAAIEKHFERITTQREFDVYQGGLSIGRLGTVTMRSAILGQFPEVLEQATVDDASREVA